MTNENQDGELELKDLVEGHRYGKINPISDVELGSDDEVNQVGNYVEKRYRLMGKRNENGDNEDNEKIEDKRYRLMGKRYRLMGKRIHRLMGRSEEENENDEETKYDEKRYRLMGKRYRLMGKKNEIKKFISTD